MFVGVDVPKDRLDVYLRPSAGAFAVVRDGRGLEQLVARLHTVRPELVVLEATDGFEIMAAAALAAAGLPLAVVNPAQIRAFARANRPLASTLVVEIASGWRAGAPSTRAGVGTPPVGTVAIGFGG